MKRLILAVLTILLCAGGVASTYLLLDRKAPGIEVSGTPSLACDVTFDELLDHASASDDKGLKSFFIEEKSLDTIADNGYLTYVAVDEANHVSKKQVSVSVNPAMKQYHLELIQPLIFQVNETVKISDYVSLRNGCNQDVKDRISIEGIDYDKIGDYEVTITSKKHSQTEALVVNAEVVDLTIPRIYLSSDTASDTAGRYYSEEYFLDFVDHVTDDKDSEAVLMNNVTCDYLDVLPIYESGLVNRAGTYTITYQVMDSEGKTSTAQLLFTLNAPRIVETYEEGEGE